MSGTMLRNLVAFLIIVANVFQTIDACTVFNPPIEVEISNALPRGTGTLAFHCASKDNDLGNRTLDVNQYYEWHFCNAIGGRTLFFCHFNWGSKQQAFEVYNAKWYKDCTGGLCFWYVKSDGFYFKGYTGDLVKKYDWQ